MRPAAKILLLEAAAIRPIVEAADAADFARPTVCDGWTVRDVLAHCGAALMHAAAGTVHRFTPEDNQRDVDERSSWPVSDVLDELFRSYEDAARVIDAAEGTLDGIGIGEWIHGGDVREALGVPDAYTSAGVELALGLLLERSAQRGNPALRINIDDRWYAFGAGGDVRGHVTADVETLVRLCGGRRPDAGRYRLEGCSEADLLLFS